MKGYHIQISLEGSQPLIYRKVRIPEGLTFHDLHLVVQCAMGWEDYHLYEFYCLGGKIRESAMVDSFLEDSELIGYTYDFGDNWEHGIEVVKKLTQLAEKDSFPKVIAAKGSCPPEDCGGLWGYYELKDILKKKRGSQYREMVEWLGSNSIPPFDKAAANVELKELFS